MVTVMHITLLIPGFGYPSPAVGPYEVFSSAGTLWQRLIGESEGKPLFDITTASADGKAVDFLGGVTITPDKAIGQIRKTDLIFVPSLGLDMDLAIEHNRKMITFLQRQSEKNVLIAGVCTGVALLAAAGLLDNRQATTHWAVKAEYEKRFPKVKWNTDLFITEDDNIICGGGVYASLDVCLYLVEKLAGFQVAKQCGRSLLIDAPRTWQASFSVPLLNQQHQDDKIKQAQEYMHEYFNAAFSIEELAQRVGMSARNFTRRFKQAVDETPLNYLHKLRINCAKQLLESKHKSVQEICYEVGYEDVPFFRSVFKRYAGLSPKEYQARFAGKM
jgi:transcriptional regulator GlxA family with amidase domain